MNTQSATQPKTIGDLALFLAKRMAQIKSVLAKSSSLTPEKMARIALNELRGNEFLTKCALSNPEAYVNAIVQAAHLGLEIGGVLGQAYLVPFKGEIKMMVGYRGLLSLARRSGEITSINAEIVYSNDAFDLSLGLEANVMHKPKIIGDRGSPVLVYMVAHFRDGGHHFEWMSVDEVMKIKERSSAVQSAKKSGKTTPWDTDTDEMIRKTVVRRGWKYLPMSIEMQSAQQIESAIEQDRTVMIDSNDGTVLIGIPTQTEKELLPVGIPPQTEKELLPACTATRFAELAQECEALVRSGKKSAKQITAVASTTMTLSNEQKMQIDLWAQEGNGE